MDAPFVAASHSDILHLLVTVAVLLATARLLGEISQRLGQPSVIGEILAGVLLGPSVLGLLAPELGAWVVPQTAVEGYLLELVALIGVMLLLIITGFEIDLGLIRRRARTAFGVATGGLVLPLLTGLGLGLLFPTDLLPAPNQRLLFALFLATAMSITAIPVLAKVLIDLNLMRRDLGQTMLAAGMIDDITGWTLLGVVAGLASAGRLEATSVLRTMAMVILFVVATLTVGRFLVRKSLDLVQDRMRSRDRLLTLVVVLAFGWGALTQVLGLEPMIGAFAIGILFGQSPRLPTDVHRKLEAVALGIFSPIFFAVAGLKVDVRSLTDPRLLLLAGAVLGVATFGKVVGAYVGARLLSGQPHWNALAYGAGLNARGAIVIIVATLGLSLEILNQEVFTMIVVMAMLTSLAAPFALRAIQKRIRPEGEELERLRREEVTESGMLVDIRRVLLPLRPRRDAVAGPQLIESILLGRLGPGKGLAVTLFTVASRGNRTEATRYQWEVEQLFASRAEITNKVVNATDPVAAILKEADSDYDLLVLGASETDATGETLLGNVVDELVRLAPIPSLVVRGTEHDTDWRPRRIVVPTDGTAASRRAAELAFAIADPDAMVTIVHVIPNEGSAVLAAAALYDPANRLESGRQIAEDLRVLGDSFGVATNTEIKMGQEPEDAILEIARRVGADLVVLGTSVRAGSRRLFLGPRVERILSACPCPVVVLNT
ncbi:MAG TPA: cation:proton antiporter [Acidimicrobiia bacterium]|nr:cation:proton antiporter [Acidimicrobiia bacterium]